MSQTRTRLLQALQPWAAERVAEERQRLETIRAATKDLSGAERLLQRVAHLRILTAWADTVVATEALVQAPAAARRALQEALPLAHKVLADRADPDGPDHLVSLQDPEARKAKHGDYDTGYLLDVGPHVASARNLPARTARRSAGVRRSRN